MNIAVTGGLGTGKSTVSRILANIMGAELISSDELCRQQLQPGKAGLIELIAVYGDTMLNADGYLERDILRRVIFTDQSARRTVEKILHPLVKKQITEVLARCFHQKCHVIAEVPLLFEVGWQHDFDTTITVRGGKENSVARVVRRDGLAEAEAAKIADSQLPIETKVRLADHTIDNSGTMVATVQQLRVLSTGLLNAC